MNALLPSALRAIRSVFTPGMFAIFLWSVAAALAALSSFIIGVGAGFAWLAPQMSEFAYAYAMPWLASFGAAMLAWFLFPGIMPIIINFFDDRIARLIERHDYPHAMQPSSQPFWPELLHDLRFTLWAVFLNILVLPLYLVPVINLFLFYLLNGYLLGSEFFVMAARRHMPVAQAKELRRRNGRVVLIAGILLAVMATIPILNLFAPFWGIAIMVHLYHRLDNGKEMRIAYS